MANRVAGGWKCLVIATVVGMVFAGCGASEGEAEAERFAGEDFYAVPQPLPGSEPGDLIRYQRVGADGGSSTENGTTYRIMYRSESLAGEPTAVTGVATVPTTSAPAAGRGVVTVGHPTAGVADPCAPSRESGGTSLVHGSLLGSGYLVATSDYEGLGTPGRHPYLVGPSEGRSMLDAAKAARQLPDAQASAELGIFGFSQGGHAALWGAEIAASWAPELEPVGVVAGAPESEVARVARRAPDNPRLALLLVAGFAATYPELDPGDVLTELGESELSKSVERCRGKPLRLRRMELFEPEPFTSDRWARRLAENTPGTEPSPTPVLILHSTQDTDIPPRDSAELTERLCGEGWTVERRTYPRGGSHIRSFFRIAADGLNWLETRFADQTQPESTCES